mmetsp:Transcript_51960/g.121186  ORF Transcript_51960/g.121186 Transcript_51960/m.121186 type:complete len:273 (+) Transcript_51960:2233-3051(+)
MQDGERIGGFHFGFLFILSGLCHISIFLLSQECCQIDFRDLRFFANLLGNVAAVPGDRLHNLLQGAILRNLEEELWSCGNLLQLALVCILSDCHAEDKHTVLIFHLSRFLVGIVVDVTVGYDHQDSTRLPGVLVEQLVGMDQAIREIGVSAFLGQRSQALLHRGGCACELHINPCSGGILHHANLHSVFSDDESTRCFHGELPQRWPIRGVIDAPAAIQEEDEVNWSIALLLAQLCNSHRHCRPHSIVQPGPLAEKEKPEDAPHRLRQDKGA